MFSLISYRDKYIFSLYVMGLVVGWSATARGTALDDYVVAPDASYTYSLARTITGTGYTAYVLDMKSQTWRSSAEVNRTLWQHWLTIIKPTTVTGTTGMLWINGGNNGGSPPTSADSTLAGIAVATSTIVADLRMVPNQPLTFAGEGSGRYEDDILAYTFDKYLATSDATWPGLLPMVKSAVRAMDTVQAYVPTLPGGVTVNSFVVSGMSKRGWTTWLTAAVDSRVAAVAPMVIDVLNMDEQMDHHFAAYGFYSSAVQPYVNMNIFDRMDIPEGQALITIVDPYEYRDRYASLPKYGLNSSGDQFFVSDSAQFYFDDLSGVKYVRYVPNTDHGLNSDAFSSMRAFYQSVLNGWTRPQFSWTVEGEDTIRMQTVTAPTEVKLWQATNATARDFRLGTIGAAWTSSILTDQGGGVYVGQVSQPAAGWRAFFVEMTYPSGGTIPYKFTTEIRVMPPQLPHGTDLDHDSDVDGFDFLTFSNCYNGSNRPAIGACMNFEADLDKDGDVDGFDFLTFSNCFNGSNNPKRCP